MKVLTIKQPWASLIIEGYKRFEFRSWKTNYRGELLIHAGKSIDKEAYERLKGYLTDMPLGKIIGKVELTNCIKTTPEFFEERLKENKDIYTKSVFNEDYAWQMEVKEKFMEPIEVKGKLGLWNYDLKMFLI